MLLINVLNLKFRYCRLESRKNFFLHVCIYLFQSLKKIKNSLYGFKDWKIIKVPFAQTWIVQMYMELCHISHYNFFSIIFFSCPLWYFFPLILVSFFKILCCVWRNFKVVSERGPLSTGMDQMTWGYCTADTKNFMLFLCMHMHLPFSEQRNNSGSQPFYMYIFICIFRKRTGLILSTVSENW